MRIKTNLSIVDVYYKNKHIISIYKGSKLAWLFELSASCYNGGYWKDEHPWTDDTSWND